MEDTPIDDRPTGDAEPAPPGVPPGPPTAPGITRPADYYSQQPVSTAGKKGCSKWALGCGGAGCLAIILLIGGIWWFLESGRFEKMLMSELSTAVESSKGLDEDVRSDLESQIDSLNQKIENKEIGLLDLQGLLGVLQVSIGDQVIDPDEAEEILAELRKINDRPPAEESF